MCPGSSGHSFECGSLDPLHQSSVGNSGHEPARVGASYSQVLNIVFFFLFVFNLKKIHFFNVCLYNIVYGLV